ncbi:MAG: hypothetical protein A3H29_07075 [Acidobacteria bacterium RIFCSPLOWO2_02_FULL_67_21]|nr:MAG: hypothetical protein A3H29_07075 [Acidobacteria bacterium RIFCSPLOWO2_02_FULL_67_21]
MAIVGAGEIGGAAAHALAASDRVRRVLLIDPAGSIAAGKALDIQQAGAITGTHVRLEGTDDLGRAIGCAAYVIADRASGGRGEWRGDEGAAMLRTVIGSAQEAPIVLAGAQQADLLAYGVLEAGLHRRRILGSAPEALASALAAIVALEARCSPSEVALTVLGSPPAAFVVPWSEASIGGYALQQMLSPPQLSRIEARVARLWPPGAYALGAAAAGVIRAILFSSRRSCSVLASLGGEFGVRNRVGIVPAWLAPQGIAQTRTPALTPRERVQLEIALGG